LQRFTDCLVDLRTDGDRYYPDILEQVLPTGFGYLLTTF